MKRGALSALCAALTLIPISGRALEFLTATQFELPADSAIQEQTALYANDVQINGAAMDDLFLFAQSVSVAGRATDALWIIGGDARISGAVEGHLRALAQSIQIEGELQRDLTSASSNLRIATNAVIEGRVDAFAEQATLEGLFRGNVRIWASSITLAGTYGGNVRVSGRDIVILPGTRIAGDLVYSSSKELFLDRSVVLGGELVRQAASAAAPSGWKDYLQIFGIYAAKAASAMLAGLVFLSIFPRYVERSTRHLHTSMWRCLARGGAGLIGIPIASILLAISIIGIPLAAIALAMWGIFIYLAKIIVALHLGTLLVRSRGMLRFSQIAVVLLVGISLISLATALPEIGASVSVLVAILGFGALLSGLWQRTPPRHSHGASGKVRPNESSLQSNAERKE